MRKNWAESWDEEQDDLAERIARNREITRRREAEEQAQKASETGKTSIGEPAESETDRESIQVGWERPYSKVETYTENYSFFDDEDDLERE